MFSQMFLHDCDTHPNVSPNYNQGSEIAVTIMVLHTCFDAECDTSITMLSHTFFNDRGSHEFSDDRVSAVTFSSKCSQIVVTLKVLRNVFSDVI